MTDRREILAETLARLEAERYAPRRSWKASNGEPEPLEPLTPEQQAFNRRVLAAAIGAGDEVDELSRRRAS